MGDNKKATLAMARKELEDLYAGVVDDSVNLTFQDLAQVTHQKIKQPPSSSSSSSSQSPPLANMEAASKSSPQNHNSNKPEKTIPSASLAKLPSLDFSKAFENSLQSHQNHHHYHMMSEGGHHDQIPQGHHDHHHLLQQQNHHHHHHHVNEHQNHHHYKNQGISSHDAHDHHHGGFAGSNSRHHHMDDHNRSFVYDGDVSQYMSGMSMSMGQERSGCGRRRPGIPHSNICAVCCNYTYLFRHRCLVCGRVYCRQCVRIGMGDMSEGRKCIECLGRRFSQRYIHKAGNVGCCMGYPSSVKQQELIWAEKGPRRTADQNRFGHGHSVMGSRPRTPTTPRSEHHSAMNSPSFVVGSPYSHTSRHHHLPF